MNKLVTTRSDIRIQPRLSTLDTNTIYTVYLANNKLGKLGNNALWWTFQFSEQGDIECIVFIMHMIISNVVYIKFGDQSQICQIKNNAKCTIYTVLQWTHYS